MKALSVRELRSELTHLDALLKEAGQIVITRRGAPIARLLPVVGTRADKPSHADLRRRMPRLAVGSEGLIAAERENR